MLDMQSIICVNPFLLQYLWMKQNWGAGTKQIHHDLLHLIENLKLSLSSETKMSVCMQTQLKQFELPILEKQNPPK